MPDEAGEIAEVQSAQQVLATIPEYDWLTLSDDPWYTVAQVAPHMAVSKETVRDWCETGQIRHATLYKQQVGWRMPRSGLLLFFARRVRDGQQNAG